MTRCLASGMGATGWHLLLPIHLALPYPAVDSNVLRVVSRVGGAADIAESAVKQAWEITHHHIACRSSDWGLQSLMEAGRSLPANGVPNAVFVRSAKCAMRFLTTRTNRFPVKAPQKRRRLRNTTVFLLQ